MTIADFKTAGTFTVTNRHLYGAVWTLKAKNGWAALKIAQDQTKRDGIDMRGRGKGWEIRKIPEVSE